MVKDYSATVALLEDDKVSTKAHHLYSFWSQYSSQFPKHFALVQLLAPITASSGCVERAIKKAKDKSKRQSRSAKDLLVASAIVSYNRRNRQLEERDIVSRQRHNIYTEANEAEDEEDEEEQSNGEQDAFEGTSEELVIPLEVVDEFATFYS